MQRISTFGNPIALPFGQHEGQFVETVFKNNFTILYGTTGSGKTLRGPVAIHKERPDMRIAVTQLRRNAVDSISEWMAFEQGWRLGGEHVGILPPRNWTAC